MILYTAIGYSKTSAVNKPFLTLFDLFVTSCRSNFGLTDSVFFTDSPFSPLSTRKPLGFFIFLHDKLTIFSHKTTETIENAPCAFRAPFVKTTRKQKKTVSSVQPRPYPPLRLTALKRLQSDTPAVYRLNASASARLFPIRTPFLKLRSLRPILYALPLIKSTGRIRLRSLPFIRFARFFCKVFPFLRTIRSTPRILLLLFVATLYHGFLICQYLFLKK